jgi:hypothetical protein
MVMEKPALAIEKLWQIWMEGYPGIEGIQIKARHLGEARATTFKEACVRLCSPRAVQEYFGTFDEQRLTVWGCRLFDNEADARKGFG